MVLDPATASARDVDPPLDDASLRNNVRRQHDWEPLVVEGTLPAEVEGTWIRTGPGIFERFGRRVEHAFEADGVLVGLRIANGRAEGAVKVVEGPGWREEERVQASLYGSTAPWWRRLANGLRVRAKATGNTSLMHWQGRTFALMEASGPLEIDPRTLATLGPVDFDGVVRGAFSAHPHRVDRRRTTFNFGLRYGPRPALDLFAFPDRGQPRRLGRVPLPWNAMLHDFAVTDRHAVFVVCPMKARLLRAVLGWRGISGIFAWDADAEAQLVVVPLGDVERSVRIPIAPRFVFHLANAYEEHGEIVVDVVQYPDAAIVTAISGSNEEHRGGRAHLQRLRVDPAARRLRSDEPLWDASCEFPIVAPAQVGEPYDALWLVAGEGDARGLARLDPRSGAVDGWLAPRGNLATEPMHVASRNGPGYLVSLVLDATIPESYFAVFDAGAVSAGPLARIWMSQPLHATYHGVHIPA